MHEDSPLRKCSTTKCCSNYTYVYQDFFVASDEEPGELPPGLPGDRDPAGPPDRDPAGTPDTPGAQSGSCEIDISAPGTFVGESRSF